MAIIKRPIMKRAQIIALMDRDIKGEKTDIDHRQVGADVAAYLLADDKTVKIYHSHEHGGNVVEYDDGK